MEGPLHDTLAGLDRGRGGFYSAPERAEIERLYFRVMGRAMRVSSCPNRWADAVVEMRIFLRNNNPRNETTNMENRKYIMKRGVILRYRGQVYSFASITDDVAKKALAENPNIAWMFTSIPEKAKTAEEVKSEPVETAEDQEVTKTAEEVKKPAKKAKKQ